MFDTDLDGLYNRYRLMGASSAPVPSSEPITTVEGPQIDASALIDRNNPLCPFHSYIGNDNAVRRLLRAASSVHERPNRSCEGLRFALLGPASTGKTSLASKFAECVQIPFITIHPKSIQNIKDFLHEVLNQLAGYGQVVNAVNSHIELPECLIFIDEVHSLCNSIVQALLKATEPNDCVFSTGDYVVDCRLAGWMIATTDRGSLFDAFDTRFVKVFLTLYTEKEIAQIVHVNYPDWDMNVCELVAKYGGRLPREVLAFAKEMVMESKMSGSTEWEDIVKTVAADNGIDEHGMSLQSVRILKALHDRKSIPKARMCDVAGCKQEELERFVMPPLMSVMPDRDAYITMSTKGYVLTEVGMAALRLRGMVRTYPAAVEDFSGTK